MDFKTLIRTVPDFPKAGIRFRDITPLLANGPAFQQVLRALADRYTGKVDKVVGIEARGFIFGAAIAHAIGAGFVPMRKPGKLPAEAMGHDYALEVSVSGPVERMTRSPGARFGSRVVAAASAAAPH